MIDNSTDIISSQLQQYRSLASDSITRSLTSSATAQSSDRATATEAAQGFSALLIQQLFDAMRKTVDHSNDPLHGGQQQEFFEDLLYQEYAQLLAGQDSFGLNQLIIDGINAVS